MKLMTATANPTQRTVPGEIVLIGRTCRRAALGGRCGCEKVFAGLGSGHFTDEAVIADVDITLDQLADLVRNWGERTGQADGNEAAEIVADLVDLGDEWPVGTRITRNGDQVYAAI